MFVVGRGGGGGGGGMPVVGNGGGGGGGGGMAPPPPGAVGKGGGGGIMELAPPNADLLPRPPLLLANMVLGLNMVTPSEVPLSCACRCAASIRSARLPCRSGWLPTGRPVFSSRFSSLLKAYWTVMGRLPRYWLCMQSMAVSDASKESYETNPKPLDSLVFSSLDILGGRMSVPKAEKVSYRRASSTSKGSRLATNRLAPTSLDCSALAFRDDFDTRIALPYNLIMFSTVMA